ncbi:hypothetical protein [Eubacterium ventriosum]|uniref:ATP synthase beta subunit C-terminal domain-containing protein n=1 Tax=Eubacterium ventriosum TaxID=39496 RepID=UPI003C12BBBE
MKLLQEEAELDEIVKMVGMDALSAPDRLKMEASRSIREDYLHQNSFHEVDTYTSLRKQYMMMELVLGFYNKSMEALKQGASVDKLLRCLYVKQSDVLNIHTKTGLMKRSMK